MSNLPMPQAFTPVAHFVAPVVGFGASYGVTTPTTGRDRTDAATKGAGTRGVDTSGAGTNGAVHVISGAPRTGAGLAQARSIATGWPLNPKVRTTG
jgi:hypothetical protein